MPPLQLPLRNVRFSLNASGLAGIFGGEETLSAMTLIPLYQGRRWLGWYNAPGSLYIARCFGSLAQSQLWQRVFPQTTKSPAALLGFDGYLGPEYVAALSATKLRTGHLGYLTMERCKEITEVVEVPGRPTAPAEVVLIDLGDIKVDYYDYIPRLTKRNALLAVIPIIISIVSCIMCALVHDWYCFSTILTCIVASGLASIVIGLGKLQLQPITKPPAGSPIGDGILIPYVWEGIIVVVRGAEDSIDAITKAKFVFELRGRLQHAMGLCSLLLILEFLVQFLLIPQGTLFGQLMFVSSVCVSWVYTYYISSFRRNPILAEIFFHMLENPQFTKFRLENRVSLAAFVTFLVFDRAASPPPHRVQKMLRTLVSNDMVVFDIWRSVVAKMVFDPSSTPNPDQEEGSEGLSEADKKLLDMLLEDARSAYEGYQWLVKGETPISSSQYVHEGK